MNLVWYKIRLENICNVSKLDIIFNKKMKYFQNTKRYRDCILKTIISDGLEGVL